MMKTYLEIQVPIAYDAPWLDQLRQAFDGIPVGWQKGWYHITMAFLNDTPTGVDLRPILDKHLRAFSAPVLTFDKLDVFSTRSGTHIIYLTSSDAPQSFLSLTEDIRKDLIKAGCQIDGDFRLHVTLGRIRNATIKKNEIRSMMKAVTPAPFTLTLTDIDHREFQGRRGTLYTIKLQKES